MAWGHPDIMNLRPEGTLYSQVIQIEMRVLIGIVLLCFNLHKKNKSGKTQGGPPPLRAL